MMNAPSLDAISWTSVADGIDLQVIIVLVMGSDLDYSVLEAATKISGAFKRHFDCYSKQHPNL